MIQFDEHIFQMGRNHHLVYAPSIIPSFFFHVIAVFQPKRPVSLFAGNKGTMYPWYRVAQQEKLVIRVVCGFIHVLLKG